MKKQSFDFFRITGAGILLAWGCGADNTTISSQPSGTGGATSSGGAGAQASATLSCTNPSTAVERFCCDYYAFGERCSPPVQTRAATFEAFSPLCQQFPIHKNWKGQATDAYAACLKNHACGNKADDECLVAVWPALPPETSQETQLREDCLQKRSKCDGIADDYCSVRILSSAAQGKLKACLDLACNEVVACLKAAFETGID